MTNDHKSQNDDEMKLSDADFSALEADGAEEGSAGNDSREMEKLRAELAEQKEKHLRVLAEFDNYKKRVLKERSELVKYQGEQVLLDILPIMDNFDLALQHLDADPAKVREGVEMIHKELLGVLSKWEVKPEPSLGLEFDPTKHSALSKVPTADAKAGTIISEFRKPYFYKDKLLRAGEVVVAVEPNENGEKSSDEESSNGDKSESA